MTSVFVAACVLVSSAFAQERTARPLPPLDPNEYKNLAEAKLECPKVGEKPLTGVRPCAPFKADVLAMVKARLDQEIKLRYDGKEVLDWKTGETVNAPGPVCNLINGEDAQNHNGRRCGQFCHLRVKAGLSGIGVEVDATAPYCERERSWYYGFQTQAKKFFILQTLKEFKDSGRFKLSKLDGEVGCHALVADVMNSQKIDLNQTLDTFISKYGAEKAVASACDNKVSDVTHTACRMQMIEKRLVSLWSKAIRCEGLIRYKNDFKNRAANPEELQEKARMKIEPSCRGQYNADCVACTNSTRSTRLNKCYENELPAHLKNEFKVYETRELEGSL